MSKEEYSFSNMVRLYTLKEYIFTYEFLISILFVIAIIIRTTYIDLDGDLFVILLNISNVSISLIGILLGLLIGAMAIVSSLTGDDFIIFIKNKAGNSKTPLYNRIIFQFIWSGIWLTLCLLPSIMVVILGSSLFQIDIISHFFIIFIVFSCIYGLLCSLNAIFYLSYLAILRANFIEKNRNKKGENF